MEEKSNKQSDGEFLISGRIVPVRREGNKVFVRTLRRGEEDTGERVTLQAGDQMVFEPGAFVIDSREIDAQSPKGFGGYAPVANTVWTWYRIVSEELGFFLFIFSLARRIDAAHGLWVSAIQARNKAREEGGIPRRSGFFNELATTEVAIIALHRGIDMVSSLIRTFSLDLEVPDNVRNIRTAVAEIRHAFEHIDERAQGKPGRFQKPHPDALSIFNQPDFFESSILRYKGHSLNFEEDVISALLDCREFIMAAIDARAAQSASNKAADNSRDEDQTNGVK